jgi:hypothetical protein
VGVDGAVGEIPIGGYVDLLHAIAPDELAADGGRTPFAGRAAAGEIEILDLAGSSERETISSRDKSVGWFNCCQ